MYFYVFLRVSLVAAICAIFLNAGDESTNAKIVSSASVRSGSVENLGEFIGTLYFSERVNLASEVSGVVENLLVNDGARVKKGAILARLNSELLQKEIAQKEALLDQAKVQAQKALREFERLSELYDFNSVSPKEFEDARFDKDAQASNAKAVASELSRLKSELLLKQIKAPFDGIVIERLLKRGEWVATGAAVFNIARLDSLEASVDVPFAVAKNLRAGESVKLIIAEREYGGRVKAIIPLGDAKARTFPIKISVHSEEGALFEGLPVRVKFKLSAEESGLLIPRDSIIPKDGKNLIYVIRDNKAVSISVEVLIYSATEALVRSSELKEGERVVVRGQERLQDNEVVRAR